jgi:hypothetical protein
MVRNLEHAALSLFDRAMELSNMELPGWWGRAFVKTSNILVDLFNRLEPERRLIVHYESFVADLSFRRSLQEKIQWPMTGDLEIGLKRQRRWLEMRRHERQVTTKSLKLRSSETNPGKLEYAAGLVAQCKTYQRLFGYAS